MLPPSWVVGPSQETSVLVVIVWCDHQPQCSCRSLPQLHGCHYCRWQQNHHQRMCWDSRKGRRLHGPVVCEVPKIWGSLVQRRPHSNAKGWLAFKNVKKRIVSRTSRRCSGVAAWISTVHWWHTRCSPKQSIHLTTPSPSLQPRHAARPSSSFQQSPRPSPRRSSRRYMSRSPISHVCNGFI